MIKALFILPPLNGSLGIHLGAIEDLPRTRQRCLARAQTFKGPLGKAFLVCGRAEGNRYGMNFSLESPRQGRSNCGFLRQCGSRSRRHSDRRFLLRHGRRRISYIDIPSVIGPFIEFRRPNNRPQQKTAYEAQHEDIHVVRCLSIHVMPIAQSIAGSPASAHAPSMISHRWSLKRSPRVGVSVGWRLGWEEHAPNRGRLGTAVILGGL